MRLIDADEVLKRWGLKFYAMGGDRLGPNGDEISFYVNGLLNEIQNAPTVEPLEKIGAICNENCGVRTQQGEWIEDSGNIACSHCHTIWLYRRTNFCPECGADMRKENKNGD